MGFRGSGLTHRCFQDAQDLLVPGKGQGGLAFNWAWWSARTPAQAEGRLVLSTGDCPNQSGELGFPVLMPFPAAAPAAPGLPS